MFVIADGCCDSGIDSFNNPNCRTSSNLWSYMSGCTKVGTASSLLNVGWQWQRLEFAWKLIVQPLHRHPQKIAGLYLLMEFQKEYAVSPWIYQILYLKSPKISIPSFTARFRTNNLGSKGGGSSGLGNRGEVNMIGIMTCIERFLVDLLCQLRQTFS